MAKPEKTHAPKTLIGRQQEAALISACLDAGRHVLVEGPVGVGKTTLVSALLEARGDTLIRVDGDHRYTEQKLTGGFDPNLVLKSGYSEATFTPGPLVSAMRSGATLFVNELNRLPEAVQNVLLPAIDEGRILIPRLGWIQAEPGFRVIATQNPKEFVATSHLSEALLDRFEWIFLRPQTFEDEVEIVRAHVGQGSRVDALLSRIVSIVRKSREFEGIRRGASVRAALAMAKVAGELQKRGEREEANLHQAAHICLPTRLELEPGQDREKIIDALLGSVDTQASSVVESTKKKP